jgi:hypothetical protein
MEARAIRRLDQVARDVVLAEGGALTLFVVGDRPHVDQVDHALELLGEDHGHLDRHRLGAEAVFHHTDDVVEVGADAVHLVDERDARNAVLVAWRHTVSD